VEGTNRAVKHLLSIWEQVDIHPTLTALGPFPVEDKLGYGVAIAMLLKSMEGGSHDKSYQQFETIRKLRSGFSNVFTSGVEGAYADRSCSKDKVKHFLNKCPTNSTWFE
jgi:hypothetical protein